ncbi:unnamed protein product [Mytilus coruscus]|uniref:Uncharacterized protein n=1 Tax=Mytilus coruscus TaxID=42192 RepID=A0A6J8ER61_MYTCO|nr:unnamed protein product [Mytilus coruscus]
MEICEVIDENRCNYEDRASVRTVNTVERKPRDLKNEWDEMYSNFPVQLKPLLDSSKENLDLSENLRLASLLLDFKDTFSKHDLDIGHYTKDKKEPEEHELYLCSPSIKHLWNCKHQLVLKDGILCYKWLDPVHSRLLLVVPRSLRHKIVENCHDTKLSGHFGQAKTIERLKVTFGTCSVNFEAKETAHHVIDLKNTLQEAHKLAREKLQAAQLRQKRIYDIKLFHKTYEVGDMVFKLDSTSKVGQSKKLRAPWQGPYVVIRVLSPVLYEITGRKKEMIIHHDRIKQCDDEIVPLWIKRLRNRLFEENELPDGWSDVLFSLPYSNCDSSAVQLNRNGESSVNRDSRPVGLDLDSENDINHGSCADPLDLAKMSSGNSDSSAVLLSPDKNTLKVPDKTESSGREKRKRVLPSYLSDTVVDVVSEET